MDTTATTLPAAPEDLPPTPPLPTRRRSRWPWVLGALAALVVTGLLAGLLVELPYYAVGPGSARPTEPAVTVSGVDVDGDAGEELLFTTVLVDPVNAFELIEAWVDEDTDVVAAEEIDGDQTPQESRRLNQQLMTTSQEVAVVVALEHLGYDVVSGTGATVAGTVEDTPADGVVAPGDTVVRAGGERVQRVEDLVAAIEDREPGDRLALVVESEDGDRRREVVELGAFPDDPDDAFLGVAGLSTRDLEVDLPFSVTIDAGTVSGPSAGLAFTLAVLDTLTPGDLSGGRPVAVTGTIDGTGRVGPVGGVEFKAVAAQRAGAEVFLVPEGEEELAASRVGDGLEIIPVATLDDALAALADLGGDALDLEAPTPT